MGEMSGRDEWIYKCEREIFWFLKIEVRGYTYTCSRIFITIMRLNKRCVLKGERGFSALDMIFWIGYGQWNWLRVGGG